MQTGQMSLLYDQVTREAISPGEKLEMIALKSLSTGSQDELFKEFDFESQKISFEAERFLGKQHKKPQGDDTAASRLDAPPLVSENPFAKDLDNLNEEGAFNFFDNLSNAPQPKKEPEVEKKKEIVESPSQSHEFAAHHDPNQTVQETISRNANWNMGHENLIKKNLLIGNLQYAAEVALKCGRTTTALLIAERGGPELFQDIKQRYFELEKDSFITSVV